MRHRAGTSRRRGRGFTLIELLVVLGIVAVLVSLLLPSLTKARRQANALKCAGNLRQIYLACMMFAQDHRGQLPRPAQVSDRPEPETTSKVCAWTLDATGAANLSDGVLWKYLPGKQAKAALLMCPSDPGDPLVGKAGPLPRNFSYSFNFAVCPFGADRSRGGPPNAYAPGVALHTVKDAAYKIYIYEELAPGDAWHLPDGRDDFPSGRHGCQAALSAQCVPNGYQKDVYRYQGRGNHVFFDGHVGVLSPDEVMDNAVLKYNYPLTALDPPMTFGKS